MPDYWDIDEILSTDESVDCTFTVGAIGLGHLDPLKASTGVRDVSFAGSLKLYAMYTSCHAEAI